jgi:hypothetical protein
MAVMDVAAFRESLAGAEPPAGASLALQALWWEARGDWDRAHKCAQAQADDAGHAVHAYLHRKEGDLNNAGGWYRRAGRTMPEGPLDAEWEALVAELR